jgi:hypothetical protein
LISTEDLTSFIETFSNDIVIKFESMPKQNKFDEIKEYINERIACEADLMLIKKLAVSVSALITQKLIISLTSGVLWPENGRNITNENFLFSKRIYSNSYKI